MVRLNLTYSEKWSGLLGYSNTNGIGQSQKWSGENRTNRTGGAGTATAIMMMRIIHIYEIYIFIESILTSIVPLYYRLEIRDCKRNIDLTPSSNQQWYQNMKLMEQYKQQVITLIFCHHFFLSSRVASSTKCLEPYSSRSKR